MKQRIKIADIETAVDIYYSYIELGTAEVIRLFNCSTASATRLKAKARKLQKERNVITFSDSAVNTKIAYEAWGLNIVEMEKQMIKYRKIKKGA